MGTQTKHGVAHRQWLLALQSARVYAAPRQLLDSGVDVDPSSAATPPAPLLPLVPLHVASHARALGRAASALLVAPTHLESSVVAAALGGGSDLFVWRAEPSGRFDLLAPSFNRLSLVGTIVALTLGTLFVRRANQRRAIAREWE